jgi:hypothetical protein
MKFLAMIGAIALMTFGLTAQASAQSTFFFTGSGTMSLTKSGITIPCTIGTGSEMGDSFDSSTDIGTIGTWSLTGSALCASIAAVGLPWTVTVTSATTASISGVEFSSPLGTCGSGTITGTLSSGVLTFPSQSLGACTISMSLTTTPPI